jgi:DNA polymerase (family 10)
MKNVELARLLFELADYLEMKDVQFKPRAFRRAALNIESLSEDIEKVWKEGRLEKIPGVGEGIAERIEEFLKTGKLKDIERLKKEIPVDIAALNAVPGLGPKRIKLLYKKLGIKDLKGLKKAAEAGKVRALAGFDEKSEINILHAIPLAEAAGKRMLLGFALPLGEEIKGKLKALKEVGQVEVAGSLRRKKETIGDIDVLVTSKKPEKVMDYFCRMENVKRVMAKGKTKSVVKVENNLEVDLRVLGEKSWGAGLHYFTGNKAHNIKLRAKAMKKGWKLNEYGLFQKKNNKYLAGRTEEEVYKKMGLPYIAPELREDWGEIEAGLKGKLPKLLDYKAVKGDLHCHTSWSDGAESVKEMALQAKKLGWNFLGISDHSKGLAIARGLTDKELLKQKKEVDRVKDGFKGLKVLHGVEANIKPNGKIDVSDKALKELDYANAAVHSNFKMPKKEMTARIMAAMENEHVKVIAHPTGRKIGVREAFDVDLEKLFDQAKATDTLLEINAYPVRLDLKDVHVKMAVENKVKLVIGTDAHTKENLRYVELGAATARRGWAEKKDIVNAWPLKKVLKALKR